MATIPIMVVFDGATIIETFGTGGSLDNPITISGSSNCIYMMTQGNYVVSSQAGDELKVSANPEDIIQWRCTDIDRTYYSPILVKFDVTKGSGVLSTPTDNLDTLYYYVPQDASDPSGDTQQVSCLDDLWEANVSTTGDVTYHWTVEILDENGDTQGFYKWDPYITVTAP